MRGPAFSTLVSFFAAVGAVSGLKVPFERRAPRGASMSSPRSPKRYSFAASSTDKEKVGNVNDMRYTAKVSVNGKTFTLALDTGSTDLWVYPNDVDLGSFNNTKIPVTLVYGDGSYGAKGTIGVTPVSFGSYTIEKQAFLDVSVSTIGGLTDVGVDGIIGLSFDLASASKINDAVKAIDGDSATWGHSFLRNVFDQHPDQPNFIAVDLARSDDLEDTAGGSFYIGEYDPTYSSVQQAPKLGQFPEGHNRWTVLLEGVTVDGSLVSLRSSVKGVPSGQVQALLDTGDPSAMFPVATRNAIYSKIPGAAYAQSQDIWLIPCNTTTIVELSFGGQKFPIHPLDLSTISDPINLPDGSTAVTCVSSIRGSDDYGDAIGYEVALGDSFLRNVYSVYDFGDIPDAKPYVQLLSQITIDKAKSQVATIRSKTMASLPPEIPPAQLLRLLGGDSDVPASDDDPVQPEDGKNTKSMMAIDNEDDGIVKKYGLIAIILLAANLVVGLTLLAFAILNYIRRGASRKGAQAGGAGQYFPVKLQDDASSHGYKTPFSH